MGVDDEAVPKETFRLLRHAKTTTLTSRHPAAVIVATSMTFIEELESELEDSFSADGVSFHEVAVAVEAEVVEDVVAAARSTST